MSNELICGKDFVLYHFFKDLGSIKLNNNSQHEYHNTISKDMYEELKAIVGKDIPNKKLSLIAEILNPYTSVTTKTNELKYTIAIGYREDIKTLIVSIAKPSWEEEKPNRKQGYRIATQRLFYGLEMPVEWAKDDDIIRTGLYGVSVNDLSKAIERGLKFFKDKITSDTDVAVIVNTDNGKKFVSVG